MIRSAKYAREHYGTQKAIRLYGQEDVWNTWAIANINVILHGLDAQIKKEDTLLKPQFLDGSELKQFDIVFANFPFSFENWWKNGSPKKDRKGKPVNKKDGSPQLEYPSKDEFSDPYDRFVYGIPPFSNGDFAFLQHIVASMKDNGRAGVVCPQGVLFRGQPEKTEEEDGQNRKADAEYLIRKGFLTGLEDEHGNKIDARNIVEAIVVLPENLFYGTTIPGSILFLNRNKSAKRKDKVLMVYAAREGWYKEEPNMNVLLPHDILRVMTMLESWGDIEVAKQFIPEQETRLYNRIQESLDFKLSEIEVNYKEDIDSLEKKIGDLKVKHSLTKVQRNDLGKKSETLQKLLTKKQSEIMDARTQAEKERQAIRDVKAELLEMFADPELRKRYFAIVDLNDLEENEFNLHIPRYVDTFEPEEEIDLKQALKELENAVRKERLLEQTITSILESVF